MRSENTSVPTLRHHVNYQELSEAKLAVVRSVRTVGELATSSEIAQRNVLRHLGETLACELFLRLSLEQKEADEGGEPEKTF